jgi:NCS1 family nucleobase:cation symporter-1
MSRASVVEWSLGLGWGGWGYYYGPWSRIALTESAAFQGPFWGWGPLEMVAAIPSAFTAIVTGDVDPTAWMIKIFGLAGGILALVLMAVANITSICCLSYSQAIPIKYYKPQWSWFKAVATNFPAIALFFPLIFYKYASVLAMEGSVAAPYAAILIVDQFIVRKGRFNLKELFYKAPGCMSERGYVKGFFVPAWVVWIVSILFYYTMYNPMTYTTGPLGFIFYWATAQIPEFILAFVLYLAIMKAGKFF